MTRIVSMDPGSRRAGPPRLRGLVLLLLACSAVLGSRPGAQEPRGEASTSHQRMLEVLDGIRRRAARDNPYMGVASILDYRAKLERASDTGPAYRARLLYGLGQVELQKGETDQAIADLTRAYELLHEVSPDERPHLRLKATYELAIAHLRSGENENCVARHTSRSCILPIGGDGVHVDQRGSRTGIRYLREILDEADGDSVVWLCSRWLLNVAYMTIGEYPDGVPEDLLIPPSVFESEESIPRFVDIAPELGLNTIDNSGGAVAEDFDGDGYLDLLTSTWIPNGQIRYFRSAGDGSFDERTSEAGLDGLWGGLNLVPADYDNDGNVDVLVLRGAWLGTDGRHPNSLLRNEGGRFTDVTFDTLGSAHYPTQTAAWADYDNDGDLDLYVGNEATPQERYACQLFRNEGGTSFTDVAVSAGTTNMLYTKGVCWGDYDADGLPDLYVSNLNGRNRLYHNEGGKFRDRARKLGVTNPINGFTVWFWDFDNDGALDVYVSSYHQEHKIDNRGAMRLFPTVASYLGIPNDVRPARLYRNDGRGGFEDVTLKCNLGRISLTMGANLGDLDNDGFLDFYLGTGYPHFDGLVPNIMYKNQRGRRFADVTTAGGFGHLQKGHAVVFADLDNDGDQDVFQQMGGSFPADAFGNALYENPGFGNHWIKVELEGKRSNRFGIGARIRADITENGEPRSIHREVSSGGSFGGNPFMQHIGVGQATRIERLEVYWPASDTRQVFEDLPVDRRIRIVEGESEPVVEKERPLDFHA